jgi:hypothetical protein
VERTLDVKQIAVFCKDAHIDADVSLAEKVLQDNELEDTHIDA